MHIAMSNALALMSWHDLRLLLAKLTSSGSVGLLIGLLLALVVISALAIEAALVVNAPHRLQSRARWPADASEAAVAESPGQADLDGSVTPT
jgi:hypothetical protein